MKATIILFLWTLVLTFKIYASDISPDEIGPHSRTWRASSANGQVVEIATGMNYFNGEKWVPSDPSFVETPQAFIAAKVQHKVQLSRQLNRVEAVTMRTPDGLLLKSTPVAIGFYNAKTGQAAFIASIRDSFGVLIGINKVLYKDAFNENGVSGTSYTL